MQYIYPNTDNKHLYQFLYEGPGGPKISLCEGPDKFNECIQHLKNLKPLPPLELCEDLVVEVPKEHQKWASRENFADLLGEKKANLAEHYQAYQFHFDIGSSDPETCAVIQIVDDNNTFKGSRRHNILSPHVSSLGLSSYSTNKKNCVYMLFAKKSYEKI